MMPSALARHAATLGVALDHVAVEKLDHYLSLLEKWNAVINLTAIRDRERMITLHVLDSFTVAPCLDRHHRLLDVGSGAGIPGIPLAVACPHLEVTLLEPNQKKAAFLRQARLELGLDRVNVVAERVERWETAERFDVIISRAFSDLPDFLMGARSLLEEGGEMIAMKGGVPFEEIQRLPEEINTRVLPVSVPELEAERHLVLMDMVRK